MRLASSKNLRREPKRLNDTLKKQIEKCVEFIKKSTYEKGEDVWQPLPLRNGIAELVGSKSQHNLLQVQEGLTYHPNIMYRLTKDTRRGRKPREYRYVTAEEKIANQSNFSAYNYITQNKLEYIKEMIKDDIQPEMYSFVLNTINALSCQKVHRRWTTLDVNKLARRILLSVSDTKEILSFLEDHKLLIRLENELTCRLVLSEKEYNDALVEAEDPEKIKTTVSARLITLQDRSLLIKNFVETSSGNKEEKFSINQINVMIGELAKKRLDHYFQMEELVKRLEKENEILKNATKNTLINNDMSMNTFEALHKEYLKQADAIKEQNHTIKSLKKDNKQKDQMLKHIRKELESALSGIDKLIDDYLFLDISQLRNPRIVSQLKEDIHVYAKKVATITSDI